MRDSLVWRPFGLTKPELRHYYGGEDEHYMYYYQNPEYQYITDLEYISPGNKEQTLEFFKFLLDMKGTGKKYDTRVGTKDFQIEDVVFAGKNIVRLYDRKESCFCYINYKWISKIIKILER